jgi:hypothetical protein
MTTAAPECTATYTCSIVIEWENFRLSEAWRAEAMLEAIHRNIGDVLTREASDEAPSREAAWLAPLRGPIELVMVYNPTDVDVAQIQAMVARSSLAASPDATIAWRSLDGGRYYELKNEGARHATGDFLLFTDSDVIQQAGWLRHLLNGLTHPEAVLVGGFTQLDDQGFLDKAFALAWLFPARRATGAMHPHPNFQAHSFGMRRETFLRHPFPDEPYRERGACVSLAKHLEAKGLPVFRVPEARTLHPRPYGLDTILARTLCKGLEHLWDLGPRRNTPTVLAYAIFMSTKTVAWACRNILRDYRLVKMPIWQVPAALVVMASFHALLGVGMIWAHLDSASLRRLWRL